VRAATERTARPEMAVRWLRRSPGALRSRWASSIRSSNRLRVRRRDHRDPPVRHPDPDLVVQPQRPVVDGAGCRRGRPLRRRRGLRRRGHRTASGSPRRARRPWHRRDGSGSGGFRLRRCRRATCDRRREALRRDVCRRRRALRDGRLTRPPTPPSCRTTAPGERTRNGPRPGRSGSGA